jgi:CMP-N,N'-diacetyllegionaminic acid synthase
MAMPTVVALIPARGGSKRVPRKNVRLLGGHPLLAYTIAAATESGVFSKIVASTEDEEIASIARHYGAEVPFMRPSELAADTSPDIGWVTHALTTLRERGDGTDCFSILRPSNPFRRATTIRRAWEVFTRSTGADSLRAVEKCRQHPGKMWVIEGERMRPLLSGGPTNPPWHSTPYDSLPPVYVQNASLEIARSSVVFEKRSIAGDEIVPFFTEAYEGLDINYLQDMRLAEDLVATNPELLPTVPQSPITVSMKKEQEATAFPL